MKKLLLATVVAGIMSTGVLAGWVEGKITAVSVFPTATSIKIERSTGAVFARYIDPTMNADYRKELLATVLTSYAQGATVQLGNNCSTEAYWCAIMIIPTP